MTVIYKLNPSKRLVPYAEWRKMGGCGLSHFTELSVARALGVGWEKTALLGSVINASIVASREIAGFAKNHLHLDSWAEVEYSFEDHPLKPRK